MNELKNKINIGNFLSIIAFLIAILPAFYAMVESAKVFLDEWKEAQKRMVILQQGYADTLQTIAEKAQPSDHGDRLDSIVERLNEMGNLEKENENGRGEGMSDSSVSVVISGNGDTRSAKGDQSVSEGVEVQKGDREHRVDTSHQTANEAAKRAPSPRRVSEACQSGVCPPQRGNLQYSPQRGLFRFFR